MDFRFDSMACLSCITRPIGTPDEGERTLHALVIERARALAIYYALKTFNSSQNQQCSAVEEYNENSALPERTF